MRPSVHPPSQTLKVILILINIFLWREKLNMKMREMKCEIDAATIEIIFLFQKSHTSNCYGSKLQGRSLQGEKEILSIDCHLFNS